MRRAPSDERPRTMARGRAWVEASLDTATRDLGLSRSVTIAIVLMPVAIVLGAVAAAGLGTGVYKWLIREDGPVENLQVLLFLGSAVGSLVLARVHHRAGRTGVAAVFAVAGIGLLGIAGEEIAWGQRIIGWETPEAFAEVNRQGETTLHNVDTIEEIVRWGVFGVAVLAAIGALVYDRGPLHTRPPVVRALVPSRVFLPAFALIAGWRVFREAIVPPRSLRFAISEFTEIVELVMAATVAIFVWLQVRRLRAEPEQEASTGDAAAEPIVIADEAEPERALP